MRVDKKRKTMQETLSSLDSVLAALDTYPNLEDALLEKAQNEANKFMGKLYPTQLDFAKDILEHLVGTDVMIEIISKFLTVALPGVEIGIKSALLANMQNLGTNCTIDPIIYEKAVKEGVLFDLRQIDLYDKLTVSPLDKKIGQYFYFGTDGCESSHDVLMSAIDPNDSNENETEKTSYINRTINSSVGHYFGGRKRDFDCLLWYMKNKSVTRQVWGKRTNVSEDIFNGSENVQDWINKKGDNNTIYYQINEGSLSFLKKSGSSKSAPGGGSMIPMSEGTKYVFRNGKTFYEYEFKNSSITKLSRKNDYCYEVHPSSFVIHFYDGDKWDSVNTTSVENYLSFYDIPEGTSYKKGDFICVGKCIYRILDIKYDGNKIRNIKTRKTIDITKSIDNKTTIFIDYNEYEGNKTKGEIIKEGGIPKPTLNYEANKSWIKSKSKSKIESVSPNNCYYIDNDGDNKYTEKVDTIVIPPHDNDGPYVSVNDSKKLNNKYTKDFGVLTLDYSPRTGNILQSDGDPMHQQTPYDNVLHVFFGNVRDLHTTERDEIENNWAESSNINKLAQSVINDVKYLQKLHNKIFIRKQKEWKKINTNADEISFLGKIFNAASESYHSMLDDGINTLPVQHKDFDNIDGLGDTITKIKECIDTYRTILYTGSNDSFNNDVIKKNEEARSEFNFDEFETFRNKINELLDGNSITAYAKRIGQIMDKNESLYYLKSRNLSYPEAEKNYYLYRTLFEFNADYINSIQLFDPKVLAAQLVTSLVGNTTFGLMLGATASWKTELIRDVVKDMVQKQIAAEDFAVSDCFFTFTNDAYNGMLRAADLKQAGLYSNHGEENGNNKIDPVKLLEGLNEVDKCADQSGQTEVIKGVIMNAVGEISKDVYKENNYLAVNTQFGVNISFIETLMINLCTQLVMAILSPKVYLLILINLEMFGMSTNFDLKSFLHQFESLIRSIIKSVVDQFMQYISQEIMAIVEDLVQKLIVKLSFEQVEMYARLIKQILMHLRMLTKCGKGLGWTQDDVNYADITDTNSSQEPIDEC